MSRPSRTSVVRRSVSSWSDAYRSTARPSEPCTITRPVRDVPRAQRDRDQDRRTASGDDPDRGGVVGLDRVRPEQLGLDRPYVVHTGRTVQQQGRRGRVSQRIRHRTVDHRDTVERPPPGPPGALEVPRRPHPLAHGTDPADLAELAVGHHLRQPQRGLGCLRLKADLTRPPGLRDHRGQLLELGQRRGRRLLQQYVGPGPHRQLGQRYVRLDRRTDDHHVDLGRREQLVQPAEDLDPAGRPSAVGRGSATATSSARPAAASRATLRHGRPRGRGHPPRPPRPPSSAISCR